MNSLILNMRGMGTISTLNYASEKIGVHFCSIDLSNPEHGLNEQLTQLAINAKEGKKIVLSLDIQSMDITPSLVNSIADVLSTRRMAGVDIGAIDSVAVMVPAGVESVPNLLKPLVDICTVFDIRSSINPMETGKSHLFSQSGIGNVLLARHLLGHFGQDQKRESSNHSADFEQQNPLNK